VALVSNPSRRSAKTRPMTAFAASMAADTTGTVPLVASPRSTLTVAVPSSALTSNSRVPGLKKSRAAPRRRRVKVLMPSSSPRKRKPPFLPDAHRHSHGQPARGLPAGSPHIRRDPATQDCQRDRPDVSCYGWPIPTAPYCRPSAKGAAWEVVASAKFTERNATTNREDNGRRSTALSAGSARMARVSCRTPGWGCRPRWRSTPVWWSR
jgi:hypothetical protein